MKFEYEIKQIDPDQVHLMRSLLEVFGEAFSEMNTYVGSQPTFAYLRQLLARDHFIALVSLKGEEVVAGLVAYELHKFEQERSELYIYDLAVSNLHRRKGIATALIEELKAIASDRGAYVIFVQADTEPADEAAIALYSKYGVKEAVLHFDITP